MSASEVLSGAPAEREGAAARPLSGVRVVSLAVNLPGPLACARLAALGAELERIEPPSGDPLAQASPHWYRELAGCGRVTRLDLKARAGREALDAQLVGADLLVTASRPRALATLGLGWDALHRRFPRLCHLAISGHAGDDAELPGHDLTYLAPTGLLQPPALPRTLAADLAGAERAVAGALALLLARERGQGATRAEVVLAEVASDLAAPLRYGLTTDEGLLGGGSPAYALYPAREGWVAVAALEPRFAAGLARELGLAELTRDGLAGALLRQTAAEWEAWARERDIPLAAVRRVGAEAGRGDWVG